MLKLFGNYHIPTHAKVDFFFFFFFFLRYENHILHLFLKTFLLYRLFPRLHCIFIFLLEHPYQARKLIQILCVRTKDIKLMKPLQTEVFANCNGLHELPGTVEIRSIAII